jgi:hypothetical protein
MDRIVLALRFAWHAVRVWQGRCMLEAVGVIGAETLRPVAFGSAQVDS